MLLRISFFYKWDIIWIIFEVWPLEGAIVQIYHGINYTLQGMIISVLCNFRTKIDGFEQRERLFSKYFENSVQLLSIPIREQVLFCLIFTIYQNYTLCFKLLQSRFFEQDVLYKLYKHQHTCKVFESFHSCIYCFVNLFMHHFCFNSNVFYCFMISAVWDLHLDQFSYWIN